MENCTANQSFTSLEPVFTTLQADEAEIVSVEHPQYDVQLYLSLFIAGFGIIDNVLVAVVLSSSSFLRGKIVNMFIINQSLVDFVTSSVVVAETLTNLLLRSHRKIHGIKGDILCLLWYTGIFRWGMFNVSSFNLAGLTIDRYVKIVCPMWYKKHCRKRHSVIAMVMAWVIGLGLKSLVKIPTSYVDHNDECHVTKRWPSPHLKDAVVIISLFIEYFIPLLILISCYLCIVFVLRKQLKPANDSRMGATPGREVLFSKALKNTMTTLVLVALFYVICLTSNHVYLAINYFGYKVNWLSLGPRISKNLVNFNLCVNPIIYGFTYKPFQHRMKSFFTRDGNTTFDTGSLSTSGNASVGSSATTVN